MNTHLSAPAIFRVSASLCWGFSGGLASHKALAGSVVLTDDAVGFVLLITKEYQKEEEET